MPGARTKRIRSREGVPFTPRGLSQCRERVHFARRPKLQFARSYYSTRTAAVTWHPQSRHDMAWQPYSLRGYNTVQVRRNGMCIFDWLIFWAVCPDGVFDYLGGAWLHTPINTRIKTSISCIVTAAPRQERPPYIHTAEAMLSSGCYILRDARRWAQNTPQRHVRVLVNARCSSCLL